MFKKRQTTFTAITIGSLLNERYRLAEQIGEGGAGVIYKAEDEQLKRMVALKVLHAERGLAADKLERFRSEARSVARLNHPNIVTLYDYDEEGDRPYLVMEYVPGQDLWELDNSYSPNLIPFAEALPIIDGILAALEYSHAHQVIHRDLKPENVMITPDKQVKVMDFGLARIQGQSRLTQEGLVAGTASYLAPELALGEAGDHRVDLYAIGIIMYELLTGQLPFSGDDPLSIVSQHIHAPVVPPQRYNANIPDELQAIILKLLAKHPSERYRHATEVRQELAPLLAHFKDSQAAAFVRSGPKLLALEASTTHQALLDRISRGKMVGRENELAELKRRWDAARLAGTPAGAPDLNLANGTEPFVLISGEAGIGKTRLLQELQVYAGLRDGYVLHGTAYEGDTGRPYVTFANALRNYVREQSVQTLRRQTPGFIAGEVVKLAPQLAERIGYIPPNPALEPEAERARLLEQVTKFLLNMAQEQPTLLLLDDLHFADPGSLDMLETLVRNSAGVPLLIAGAYRDVALSYSNPVHHLIASLEAARLAYRIPLRRLPQEAVGQMVEALLGDTVREEFTRSIYQATEGNPLFIEEVVKSLAVEGQIILREGHWEQRDSGRLNVPSSIKAVLGGRLERINKYTLELLQLAAIIGRNFTLDILAEASPHHNETIQQAITEALQAQLIETHKSANQADTLTYGFQHALIRETLYEELRPLRRRQLHRRVASVLEKRINGQPADNPAVLAYHLINSAQDEKAVPYLWQAGEAARQVYANAETIEYFGQAREILEDMALDLTDEDLPANLTERFQLLNLERYVFNLMGDRTRELNTLKALQEVAEALHDKKRWVEVMSRLATYYWQVGRLNQAEEIARQALEVAQQHNDRRGEQYCLEQIARVLWTRRDANSMSYAAQALLIAQDLGDRRREGRLTELVGHIYTDTLHDADRAAIYFNQALAICRETGNRIEEAWTLWGIGGLALFVSDYSRALERYGEAKTISENIGATLQVGWDLYNMGDAWYNLGNNAQALACYEQAQIIFNAAHHLRGKIYTLISLGLVFMATDRLDEAMTYLEQAKRQAEARKDLILMFRSYEALSAYYRLLGDEDNLNCAIQLSDRIIKLAAESDHFEHLLLGHYLRSAGFFERGDALEALQSSNPAVAQLERLTYIHSSQISGAEIYYQHSHILAAVGQREQAQAYLQKASTETMRKANLIADSQQRLDFLSKVPLNRQILVASGQKVEDRG